MSMVREYFPKHMKDPELAEIINDSHNASIRLIEIVNDFLDSSRLEQGKMEFMLAPVAMEPLVAQVQKDLGTLLKAGHNTMVVDGLGGLPAVLADEARLRQILYNILGNACKYSQDATITVTGEVRGRKLKLLVTDTGKGISPENQKLLFHKFQQAGDSLLTRDSTKGTGLGLYIARLLAENMGGNIKLVRSEIGKGSTFAVILPLAAA
jgi:signal transduction histidine kinase